MVCETLADEKSLCGPEWPRAGRADLCSPGREGVARVSHVTLDQSVRR